MAKSGDARYDWHGHPMFRKGFSSKGSSNAPHKFYKDRMSNRKPQVYNGA